MMNKRIIIPILFILIFLIAAFSGCISKDDILEKYEFPVKSYFAQYWPDKIVLQGGVMEDYPIYGQKIYICSSYNYQFVYDIEKHNDWQDYYYRVDAYRDPDSNFMIISEIDIDEFDPDVTYHFRFVAYCHSFTTLYNINYLFHEGWYQGKDVVFKGYQ